MMNHSYHPYFFDPHVVKIGLDGGVWEPTPHGVTLAEGMVQAKEALQNKDVLELGAGCGIHAILALKIGAKQIDITEIAQEYLDNAEQNAQLNQVAYGRSMVEDWTDFPAPQQYDLLLCNPPFCKSGQPVRRHFIDRLIEDADKFVKPGGHLLFVQSSMADFALSEQKMQAKGYQFSQVLQKRGVFRDYYFTEPNFMEESAQVEGGYEVIDDTHIETLRVYLVKIGG